MPCTRRDRYPSRGRQGRRQLHLDSERKPVPITQDLQDWFDDKVVLLPWHGGLHLKDFRSATFTNKGRWGRLEVRTLTTSSQLNDFLDWPCPATKSSNWSATPRSAKLEKTRHEIVYGVTSLSAEQASPDQLLRMLRSYWKIESGLHYPRDVTCMKINSLQKAFRCSLR